MTTSLETRQADWQRWHAERETQALDAHGPAALTGTHWLGDDPSTIDGIPGAWVDSGGRAVGTGPDFHAEIAPGESLRLGELSLRALVRAGQVALRVFDPQASTRADLLGIDTFDFDPAWVVPGVAEIGSGGLRLDHIDGFVSDNPGGTVRLTVGGRELALRGTVTTSGGLQITFADTTNGVETQRFRFLTLPAPDARGRVEVDFNRAYLPPCAFSDHFLCPLPPAGNRLDFAVRAGESRLRRAPERAR
ncbi:DUF1684 domain-containing protein [Nocardia blacklockiae]|uniref:DUF1684 domain-containing protein n=1 Tax=Nocardia blacklockiae TaxID=480036 RepID=UPI001895F200|nr:DUF1684 domain-containing protein [Nocardia blacklockiae]MBF6171001.1 DUF1684 domain-containing protein [Nocardia blacklockiae]